MIRLGVLGFHAAHVARRTSRAIAVVLAASAFTVQAFAAEAISLSKAYGNKDGCINKVQQEVYSETMLLLTDTAFTTATASCEFKSKKVNKDGSLTIEAACEAEGEEGSSPATFLISRSKKHPKNLVVADADQGEYGEVAPCP